MTQTVYITAYLPKDISNKIEYGEKVYYQLHGIDKIKIVEIQKHSKND